MRSRLVIKKAVMEIAAERGSGLEIRRKPGTVKPIVSALESIEQDAMKLLAWLAESPAHSWWGANSAAWAKSQEWTSGHFDVVKGCAVKLLQAARLETAEQARVRIVDTAERHRVSAIENGDISAANAALKMQGDMLVPKEIHQTTTHQFIVQAPAPIKEAEAWAETVRIDSSADA
jgi:hypothetical protein